MDKTNKITEMVKETFGDKPYLRMLFVDEDKDRVYAKFKGKYFFPVDRSYKKPGWVAAIIVEERDNFGFIDVIPIEEISAKNWASKAIKGAFVKNNWEKNQLEIYPGMNKEQVKAKMVQNCILTIPLDNEIIATDETRNTIRKTLHNLRV